MDAAANTLPVIVANPHRIPAELRCLFADRYADLVLVDDRRNTSSRPVPYSDNRAQRKISLPSSPLFSPFLLFRYGIIEQRLPIAPQRPIAQL